MTELDRIAGFVKSTGFSCTRCGTCCSSGNGDDNLVFVTPGEIRKIMDASMLSWEEIAEPYPEKISADKGRVFTLGWCLIRHNGICGFFKNGACSIYERRPWICRTYPFSLDGDTVLISACPGLGCVITQKMAHVLARDLIKRKKAEIIDEGKIRKVLEEKPVLPEKFVVIDSEGIKEAPKEKIR